MDDDGERLSARRSSQWAQRCAQLARDRELTPDELVLGCVRLLHALAESRDEHDLIEKQVVGALRLLREHTMAVN